MIWALGYLLFAILTSAFITYRNPSVPAQYRMPPLGTVVMGCIWPFFIVTALYQVIVDRFSALAPAAQEEHDERMSLYMKHNHRLTEILELSNFPFTDESIQAGMDVFIRAGLDRGGDPDRLIKAVQYEIDQWMEENHDARKKN